MSVPNPFHIFKEYLLAAAVIEFGDLAVGVPGDPLSAQLSFVWRTGKAKSTRRDGKANQCRWADWCAQYRPGSERSDPWHHEQQATRLRRFLRMWLVVCGRP